MITNSALLAAHIVLGVALGVADGVKLVDRVGVTAALSSFGISESHARPLAGFLPTAELAIAPFPVLARAARLGARVGAILVVVILAGTGARLALGCDPACHCFSQIHSTPIGVGALWRSLVLLVLPRSIAVSGAMDAGASAIFWWGALIPGQSMGVIPPAFRLLLLARAAHVSCAGCRLVLHRSSVLVAAPSTSSLPTRDDASINPEPRLRVGMAAPNSTLPNLRGTRHSLDDLLAAGSLAVLLFVDARCSSCAALFPRTGRWPHDRIGMGVAVMHL